jgi:hypothetical protein
VQLACLAALVGGFAEPARALDLSFDQGEISGYFDTTVTFGTALRLQDRDPALIGRVNGGTANSVNVDNGDLNYDRGDLTSLQAKVNHELDLQWRNYGLFARLFYFYDVVVVDFQTARTPIPNAAKDVNGRDIQLQDAYLTGDFEVGPALLTVKLGDQVLNWGESTFIPNGINGINPVDLTRLRVAGAEVREALEPVPTLDIGLGLGPNLSLEGFYQFLHRKTKIDGDGTFFSISDPFSPGGSRLFLGFGSIPDFPVPPPGTAAPIGPFVPRASDEDARNLGQFGLALRYFAEELNQTELGLYYLHYHSNLPLGSLRTGDLAALNAGDYAASSSYFADYPEDIDLIGGSFNTSIGTSGLALQGEVSYRPNQPLQVDNVELVYAGLSPVNPQIFGQNQVGVFGFEQEIQGYRRENVLQAQMTGSQTFGPTFGADDLLLLAEIGATWVPSLPAQDELRFDGPGTFTSGNPFFTEVGVQPATQEGGFATPFSCGYRLLARASYLGAFGPVNLAPQLAFAHDVSGTTPRPLGNFVAHRKAVTLSLGADYLNAFNGEIAYTNFIGAQGFNLLRDRDFVSLSVSYSF